MKNILAAIDFSPVSHAIIDKSAEFARSFSCKLWIIHVAAPDPDFVGFDVGPDHVRDWRAAELRKEHRFLQNRARELADNDLDVTPLLLQGPTVESILAEADKIDADLIVVGTHGHGAFYELLVGTVAEGFLHASTHPLLIIPAEANQKTEE
jgi:nucleotide-binding universal stress UspA family protein